MDSADLDTRIWYLRPLDYHPQPFMIKKESIYLGLEMRVPFLSYNVNGAFGMNRVVQ